jgi:hypothetical protein
MEKQRHLQTTPSLPEPVAVVFPDPAVPAPPDLAALRPFNCAVIFVDYGVCANATSPPLDRKFAKGARPNYKSHTLVVPDKKIMPDNIRCIG